MKIYAISDIHGCYEELMELYEQLPINPEEDMMVFCGDYIDRGPDSKKVIQQLIDWKEQYPHWVVLKGNHEHFLVESLVNNTGAYGNQAYDLWMHNGGEDTLRSYLPEGLSDYERATIGRIENFIPDEHKLFIATLPVYHETEDYIFVHGGLKPGKQPADMNEYDMMWIRDEFIDSDYDWGKKVIFGHTASRNLTPIIQDNKIGIDTAVCPGANNKLTCLELPSETFYDVLSHKFYDA